MTKERQVKREEGEKLADVSKIVFYKQKQIWFCESFWEQTYCEIGICIPIHISLMSTGTSKLFTNFLSKVSSSLFRTVFAT